MKVRYRISSFDEDRARPRDTYAVPNTVNKGAGPFEIPFIQFRPKTIQGMTAGIIFSPNHAHNTYRDASHETFFSKPTNEASSHQRAKELIANERFFGRVSSITANFAHIIK
jgi:hypothetical protein